MELNREQIIKALECCVDGDCYPCPYAEIGAGCREKMSENALSLINSQEQRIKELTEENKKLTDDNKWCSTRILEADRIIIEVRKNADELTKTIPMMIKEIQADTVREMQERLKKYLDDFYNSGEDALLDVPDLIDQIAKEMLEGKK